MVPETPAEAEVTNVCVVVNVRPLVASEVEQGSRASLFVAPGLPQVSTGQHQFTYDAVFSPDGADPALLYPQCVAPLVAGLFRGYNATVFAYGQTGSGKTWTMGSEYRPGVVKTHGVIPEAISDMFRRIDSNKDWQASVRVSFVEIHKEEVRDLLITGSGVRSAVSIREVPGGGVSLCGAVEKEVTSQEEMAAVLEMGTLCRATASTNMNSRSSRSHAIFSITLEQRRQISAAAGSGIAGGGLVSRLEDDDDEAEDGIGGGVGTDGDMGEDYLCAKMHLVDLAGSERAKRTKAEGARLKEGIHINRGLLALGNVINAIVDNHKHVPYRDSKLTRLLQDSLGGNSRTVMIACASPADINFEESLNTLRYADRARHIRNKPVVNRDPVAAQLAALRQQLSKVVAENSALRRALGSDQAEKLLSGQGDGPGDTGPGGGAAQWALVEALQGDNSHLEMENMRLTMQADTLRADLAAMTDKCCSLQAQVDVLRAAHEQLQQLAHNTAAAGAAAAGDAMDIDASAPLSPSRAAGGPAANKGFSLSSLTEGVMVGYLNRIAQLEQQLRAAKQLHGLRRRTHSQPHQGGAAAGTGAEAGGLSPPHPGMQTPVMAGRQSGRISVASFGNEEVAGEQHSLGGLCTPLPELVEVDMDVDGQHAAGGPLEGGGEEDGDEEVYYAEMAAHALEQEKMKQEMTVLQRTLELKERKMAELMAGSGQVPALKQHYDRVLAEVQRERDALVNEKTVILQKLAHLTAASEEERRRLEAGFKERLAAADDKLRMLRHKEREYVQIQKLKSQTEDMCRRLSADIHRIKAQKVNLQKTMESSTKQFQQWRVEREKELVQLRRQNRRNAATIQAMEAMASKQNAVLQRKIADANAARKKLRELQGGAVVGHSVRDSAAGAHTNGGGSLGASSGPSAPCWGRAASNGRTSVSITATTVAAPVAGVVASNGPEVQPNADAPLLRNEKARREWLEKELDLCNQSFEYRRVLEGELAQRAETHGQLRDVVKRLMLVSNLVPASPLASAAARSDSQPMTPMTTAAGGDNEVLRARLMERKAALEAALVEHNNQIMELQRLWESSKSDEESKGGGAADVRRWSGIRSIVEARDLLRTIFRIASDQRSLGNDLQLDVVRLAEEAELLRVQLDAARKEAEAQRKRTAAIEATAATVMSTPFMPQCGGGAAAAAHTAADENTEREVDELLLKLHAAKTPSSMMPAYEEDEAMQLGSPDDGSCRVSIDFRRAARPTSPSGHTPNLRGALPRMAGEAAKAAAVSLRPLPGPGLDAIGSRLARAVEELDTLGKREAAGMHGGQGQGTSRMKHRRASGPEDLAVQGAGPMLPDIHSSALDSMRQSMVMLASPSATPIATHGSTDEEEPSSDGDEQDDDWQPTHITQARPRANPRRQTATLAASGLPLCPAPLRAHTTAQHASSSTIQQLQAPAGTTHPPVPQQQQQQSVVRVRTALPAAASASLMPLPDSPEPDRSPAEPEPVEGSTQEEEGTGARQRRASSAGRSTSGTARHGSSSRASSVQPSGSDQAAEAPLLLDANQWRAAAGMAPVERLTVKVMKEVLAGRSMPDGKTWRAGAKTRDQLVADYRAILGLPSLAPPPAYNNSQLTDHSQSLTPDLSCSQPPHRPPHLDQQHHHLMRGGTQGAAEASSLPAPPSDPARPQGRQERARSSKAPHPPDINSQTLLQLAQQQQQQQGAGEGALNSPGHSRDYKAAVLHPPLLSPHSPTLSRSPNLAREAAPIPWLPPHASASPHANASPDATSSQGPGNNSRMHRGSVPAGGGPDTHWPDAGATPSGDPQGGAAGRAAAGLRVVVPAQAEAGDSETKVMTPLSLLYIQKAQEARERTAALRQSIQKQASATSSSAAAVASLPASQPATQPSGPPATTLPGAHDAVGTISSPDAPAPSPPAPTPRGRLTRSQSRGAPSALCDPTKAMTSSLSGLPCLAASAQLEPLQGRSIAGDGALLSSSCSIPSRPASARPSSSWVNRLSVVRSSRDALPSPRARAQALAHCSTSPGPGGASSPAACGLIRQSSASPASSGRRQGVWK